MIRKVLLAYYPIHSLTKHYRRRSITSILVCRFMLSLREFDATKASRTISIPDLQGSQVLEHAGSTFLQFAAEPSHSLPAFIASFANPVHVHSDDDWSDKPSDSDSDVTTSHGTGDLETAEAAPSSELDVVSRQGRAPVPGQLSSPATAE